MPKAKKYGAVSERMPSRYRRPRGMRRIDLGEAVINYPKTDPTEDVQETYGACANTFIRIRRDGRQTSKCKNFHEVLGNGYCMDCWDIEIEKRANNAEERKKKGYKTSLPNS